MVSTDHSATLSYKNFSFLPIALQGLFQAPDFVYNSEDSNHSIDDSGTPAKESPIIGPSVAVIYNDATYPLNLPVEEDLVLSGETNDRLKVLNR